MMNEKVRAMVAELFHSVAESEEADAVREELENNCQEHYEDLIANGYSESTALAAVAESLQGMEEIVAQLPTREQALALRVPERTDDEADTKKAGSIPALEGITALSTELRGFDLTIERGSTPRLDIPEEIADAVEVERHGHRLILREKLKTASNKKLFGFNISWNLEQQGEIRLVLPGSLQEADLHSSSGDIHWEEVPLQALQAESSSGDIEVALPETPVEKLELSTRSGDLRAEASGRRGSLHTMSGDILWLGSMERVSAISISGDVTLEGQVGELEAKSVSGDIRAAHTEAERLRLNSTSGDITGRLAEAEGAEAVIHTTSGDVTLRVPLQAAVALQTHTISGDLSMNNVNTREPATHTVQVNTISGDIRILS